MTVHSVSLWGHSKHLVSIVSPAGDRPPGGPGPDSGSAHTHTHMCIPCHQARLHLVLERVSTLAGPASCAGTQIHSETYTPAHTHTNTHTPNANHCHPSSSLCIAKTASAQGGECSTRGLQAAGPSRGQVPSSLARRYLASDCQIFISFQTLPLHC